MSKNKSEKKARIFTPILWCLVTIMWIITVVADLIFGIPMWLMIVHAVFGLFSLIVAIVYIVQYSHRKKVAREQYI